MTGRFEVYEDRAGMWRWRLRDEHGETVAVGGTHDTENAAWRACADVHDAAIGAPITEVPA